MDWRLRSMRRPVVNEPERTCQRLTEALEEARRKPRAMPAAFWAGMEQTLIWKTDKHSAGMPN
jgi:hypothetical protein